MASFPDSIWERTCPGNSLADSRRPPNSLSCLDEKRPDRFPPSRIALTYSDLRNNLAATPDRVCLDHDPVIITRYRKPAVVLLSLEDYSSLQETACLNRSPVNARRLL